MSAFNWYENHRPWMTLNGHCAFCNTNQAYFRTHYRNFKEDRPVLSVAKCSLGTLYFQPVYGSCGYLREFCGERASNDRGVLKMVVFSDYSCRIFGTFRARANITIQQHEVLCQLSNDPKMHSYHFMLKCVFCIALTRLVCSAFEDNCVKENAVIPILSVT